MPSKDSPLLDNSDDGLDYSSGLWRQSNPLSVEETGAALRVPLTSIYLLLAISGAAIVGCGGGTPDRELGRQAEEIGRLQTQLREADSRLAVAGKQLAAANEHAERCTHLLETATKERDDARQKAAEEMTALQERLASVSERLRLANERVADIERRQKEEEHRLSPIGAWKTGGSDPYRFLFFPNGGGVFQYWDAKSGMWVAGDLPGVQLRSDGKFVFRNSTAIGAFDMRFVRRATYFDMPPPTGNAVADLRRKSTERKVEEVVEATVVMKERDALRIVGWRNADAVLTRVDEDWKPGAE